MSDLEEQGDERERRPSTPDASSPAGPSADEPDALERLRREQERRWQAFREQQEQAKAQALGDPWRAPGPPPAPESPPGPAAGEEGEQDPASEASQRIPYPQRHQQLYGAPPPPAFGGPPGYGQQPGYGQPDHGQQSGYGQPGWGGGTPPGYGYAVRETEQSAVWALVLSILSFVVCPVIAAVAALVLASSAKRAIRESHGRKDGEGLATAGQVISWVNLALVALMTTFIVIAVVIGNGSSSV